MRDARPAPILIVPVRSRDTCVQGSALLGSALFNDLQCSAKALNTAGSVILSGGRQIVESTITGGLNSARDGLKSAGRALHSAKDYLNVKIDQALRTAKMTPGGLITFDDLPDPWRINPHIKKGYRFCETQVDCVHSVFRLNNETVNVWSHAFGLVCILTLGVYVFPNSANWQQSTSLDILFIGFFLFAAAKCMICSCTYHTMNSIGDIHLNKMFTCVDYTGISLVIAASLMATEHIAFNCHTISWWIYISNTAILGMIGMAVPWHPFFVGNEKAWLRVTFYTTMVFSGLLPPAMHLSILYGTAWTYSFYAPIAKSFLVFFFGAIIYAKKWPESIFHGRFDFVGGSHNIWHFAVVGGILFYYSALSEMFQRALEVASPECRPRL